MTSGLFGSLIASLRKLVESLFYYKPKGEVLFPRCGEDVVEILNQARDNSSQVKVVGGTFPSSSASKEDIILNLQYMDKLLGLDVHQQTVIVEPGMSLAHLCGILETVNLSLDLAGPIPDLSVVDAVAIGLIGSSGSLAKNIISVEVVLPGRLSGRGPELNSWSWTTNPTQMSALVTGLGLVAVVIAVTFKCIPLYRVSEVSYLTSLRDILESWSLVHRTSLSQHLIWYPFSELVILTHTSLLNRNVAVSQSFVNRRLSDCSSAIANGVRKINLFLFSSVPLLSSVLARIQFISLWSVAKNRSDHAHTPTSFSSCDTVRGATWLLPLPSLPPLLSSISNWSSAHPSVVSSPLHITTLRGEGAEKSPQHHGRPFLQPNLEEGGPSATVWYDWFLADSSPDPTEVAQFEQMFHSAGGVKCWSGDRIVSPLVLSATFLHYREWCQVKNEIDPDYLLASGYVQGSVWLPLPAKDRTKSNKSSNVKPKKGDLSQSTSRDISHQISRDMSMHSREFSLQSSRDISLAASRDISLAASRDISLQASRCVSPLSDLAAFSQS